MLTSGPTAAAQTSGPGSSGAAGWERQAGDLVDTLQAANDPEAEQLAGKLAAIGVTGSTPATSPGPVPDTASPAGSPDAVTTDQADGSNGNNVDRGRQADDNTGVSTDATGAGTASSPGQASTAGPGSDRSASADGGNSPDSSANDQQPGGAQQSGWEQQARELADQLARAGDDPTARELTDKLASAGIIADPSPPARNGNSGQSNQTGSRGGDQGSSETGQSGQASDDPGGAGQAGEGDRTAGSQPSGNAGDGGNAGAAEQPPPAQAPAPAGNPAAHPDPGITGADPGADIGTWDRLAGCESGGRWSVSTGNGYSGGLQFDPATWKAFGGDGYAPSADKATKDQQIAVAQKVRDARGGYGSWPACSQKLGLPQ
ncbi:hypothetical protein HF526_30805 [Pseudonocardia sp. K10HN5]|uniref:Resuscitation-promoting factor core lysozyme-like domain-containing protein n=1 Tax=Pseudonocardia acidicola TaxID=2724939 RepID=A0ABX1SMM8_9PSEU|nr:hypothetical protein [Pseudonocardia acidicola]